MNEKCSRIVINKNIVNTTESTKFETHFTKDELQALCKIYKKLVASSKINMMYLASSSAANTIISKPTKIQDGVDKIVFQELLHNTFDIVIENTLMDRIFYAWDKNNEGFLRQDVWLEGLSMFLKGSMDEKMKYCFCVYDLNADGFITKEEVFQLLKNCLVKLPQEEDPDEGVKELVDTILRKLDIDKDGKISFEDYRTAVLEEPLLLEVFGQCLPAEPSCITFLATLSA